MMPPSFRPFWTQSVPGIFEREGGGFFSKLAQLLTEKMPQRASGEQVLGIASGAKPAEAEWIGLSRFLEPEQQYMKPDVLRYVQERSPSLQAVPRLETQPFEIISPSAPMVPETQNLRHIGVPQAGFMNPDYQLPGGKDYREIPVRIGKEQIQEQYPEVVKPYLPDVEGHFSPGTVFHMRTTDRQLPTGEKVLFAEEIQSDWHQRARKIGEETGGTGYIPRDIGPKIAEGKIKFEEAKTKLEKDMKTLFYKMRQVEHVSAYSQLPLNDPAWNQKYGDVYRDLYDRYIAAKERLARLPRIYQPEFGGALPVGPFEKSWPELSIKKMLNDAVARGYDGIGWTTGDQQLKRYASLSQRVGTLRWEKTPNGYALYAQGQEFGGIDPKDLSSWVGASAAKKILAGEGVDKLEATNPRVLFRGVGNVGKLEGEEIQLGGKGMRRFYDEILPNAANNYAKKWGVKVQEKEISTGSNVFDLPNLQTGNSYYSASDVRMRTALGFDVYSGTLREGKAIAHFERRRHGSGNAYYGIFSDTFMRNLYDAGVTDDYLLGLKSFLSDPSRTPDDALEKVKVGLEHIGRLASSKMTGLKTPAHYLPITPQMRKEILTKGQPLWQFAPTAIGLGAGLGAMADQQEEPS